MLLVWHFAGDYFTNIMPYVDYFVADTALQAGKWTGFLEYDNSVSVTVSA
jgi:hypothetical protein